MSPTSGTWRLGLLLVSLLGGACLLATLTLVGLRDERRGAPRRTHAAERPRAQAPTPAAHAPARVARRGVLAPTPLPDEAPPWRSTPANTPDAPPGMIPAWRVRPPAPDPGISLPEPVPPPDPAGHRPPMDNPGGVDGSRPPRNEPVE